MTLKELIELQSITGESDLDIIKEWFISNDKETEGIALITKLAEEKSTKLERTLNYARIWIPNLPELYEANKRRVPRYICINLVKITHLHLLGMPLSDKLLKWAEETIPTMKMPKIIYVPMVEWLRDEYGIEFMKEE